MAEKLAFMNLTVTEDIEVRARQHQQAQSQQPRTKFCFAASTKGKTTQTARQYWV